MTGTIEPTPSGWSLPSRVVAPTHALDITVTPPSRGNTVAVMPHATDRCHGPELAELADSCMGLVVATNGDRCDTGTEALWPHAVEVASRHPTSAAHARNVGLAMASWRGAEWAWLVDDDCTPRRAAVPGARPTLDELAAAWRPGQVAVQGRVTLDRWEMDDPATRRMADLATTVGLFVPPSDDLGFQAIVTANVLVHLATVRAVGGFDAGFDGAGGEDIDLGVRLRRAGGLIGDAPLARVIHDRIDHMGFRGRALRYGAGMRRFAEKHGCVDELTPRPEGHPWLAFGEYGKQMATEYASGWWQGAADVLAARGKP